MHSESEFIARLKHPKYREKAFLELLNLYQERLYWHIRKIVTTHNNTHDVLQNTFLRVYKGIQNFNEQSSLLTWMFRIAYNESVRFLQKNKLSINIPLEEVSNSYLKNLTQDDYFDGDIVKLELHKVINDLNDKQKQVFNMKYFDDLSFREISEILNINENTLKSTYYGAVKIIEEKMLAWTTN